MFGGSNAASRSDVASLTRTVVLTLGTYRVVAHVSTGDGSVR